MKYAAIIFAILLFLVLNAFQVRAETYVTWAPQYDTQFRKRYFAITGEQIQEEPPINDEGNFVIGSSRLTDEQLLDFKKEFPSIEADKKAPVPEKEQVPTEEREVQTESVQITQGDKK